MKKELTYFRIKVKNPLSMAKAKKMLFVSSLPNGGGIYRTLMYDNKDDVFAYLDEMGCQPDTVSRLSLQNIS